MIVLALIKGPTSQQSEEKENASWHGLHFSDNFLYIEVYSYVFLISLKAVIFYRFQK